MKLNLAVRELHRSERSLTADLLALADQHKVDHEIHHLAHDLAHWSQQHVQDLADVGHRYGLTLNAHPTTRHGVLRRIRATLSEWTGRRPEPGMLLLADLRRLHRKAAGVSLDWELLAQGAQATKDTGLLGLAQRCHPETLRQLRWANGMLKVLSPQVLAS